MELAFILDLLCVKVPCGEGNIAEPLEFYKISNAFGFPQRWVDGIIRSPSLELNPAPDCYSHGVLAIFCDHAESLACDSCLILTIARLKQGITGGIYHGSGHITRALSTANVMISLLKQGSELGC